MASNPTIKVLERVDYGEQVNPLTATMGHPPNGHQFHSQMVCMTQIDYSRGKKIENKKA